MKINWVDILIVIYLVRVFFLGKKRGLTTETAASISAVLSLAGAFHFYQGAGLSLSKWFLLSLPAARALSFGVIAVIILFCGFVAGRLLKRIMKLSFLPNIEKIGGCVLGVFRGVVLCTIVLVMLTVTPAVFLQREVYTNSFLGSYLVALSPKVHSWVCLKAGAGKGRFNIDEFWAELPGMPKKKIL